MDNETFYNFIEEVNQLAEEYGHIVTFACINDDEHGEIIEVKIRRKKNETD